MIKIALNFDWNLTKLCLKLLLILFTITLYFDEKNIVSYWNQFRFQIFNRIIGSSTSTWNKWKHFDLNLFWFQVFTHLSHLTSNGFVAIDVKQVEDGSPLLHLLRVHVCGHLPSEKRPIKKETNSSISSGSMSAATFSLKKSKIANSKTPLRVHVCCHDPSEKCGLSS